MRKIFYIQNNWKTLFVSFLAFGFLTIQSESAFAVNCVSNNPSIPFTSGTTNSYFSGVAPGNFSYTASFSGSPFSGSSTQTINCSDFNNATGMTANFTGLTLTGTLTATCGGPNWTITSGACSVQCVGNNPSISVGNTNFVGVAPGTFNYSANFSGSPFAFGSTQTINCSDFDNSSNLAGSYFAYNDTMTATCGNNGNWTMSGSCTKQAVCSTSNPTLSLSSSNFNNSSPGNFNYTPANPFVTSSTPTGRDNNLNSGESAGPANVWMPGSSFTIPCNTFDDNTTLANGLSNNYFAAGNLDVTCTAGNWTVGAAKCSKLMGAGTPCHAQNVDIVRSTCGASTDENFANPNTTQTVQVHVNYATDGAPGQSFSCSAYGTSQYCNFSSAGQVTYQCVQGNWTAVGANGNNCLKGVAQCVGYGPPSVIRSAPLPIPYERCENVAQSNATNLPLSNVGTLFTHNCVLSPSSNPGCKYDDDATFAHVDYRCQSDGSWAIDTTAGGKSQCPKLNCEGMNLTGALSPYPSPADNYATHPSHSVQVPNNLGLTSGTATVTVPYGTKGQTILPNAPGPQFECQSLDQPDETLPGNIYYNPSAANAIQLQCLETAAGSHDWRWQTQSSCVIKPPSFSCSMQVVDEFDVTRSDTLQQIISYNGTTLTSSTLFPEYQQFEISCNADRNGVQFNLPYPYSGGVGISFGTYDGSADPTKIINSCSIMTGGICFVPNPQNSAYATMIPTSVPGVLNVEPQVVARVMLKNLDVDPYLLPATAIQIDLQGFPPYLGGATPIAYHGDIGGTTQFGSLYSNLPLPTNLGPLGSVNNSYCVIVPSGAISSSGNQFIVSNGVVILQAAIMGASGEAALPRSITWSGAGVDANGVVISANPAVTATATIQTYQGNSHGDPPLTCTARLSTLQENHTVQFSKFADCEYFEALRSYYLTVSNGTTSVARSTPFATNGIQFPGIKAQYGARFPEVPFKGVLNGAADHLGAITIYPGGIVTPPTDINQRAYSGAVIVAHKFTASTNLIDPDPAFYAVLDYSNYSVTRLNKRITPDPAATDTFVFRAFLAHNFIAADGITDMRGSGAENLAFYRFNSASPDALDMPLDRIIPFVNESCVPLFQITPPNIPGGGPLPAKLASVTTCSFSRPYTYADIDSSRVRLNIMHIVPDQANQEYPLDLMRASYDPPPQLSAAQMDPANLIPCWNISASDLGQNISTPYAQHDSCRQIVTAGQTTTVAGAPIDCGDPDCGEGACGYYPDIVTQTPPVYQYVSNCPVVEQMNSCRTNLAIRFSGYNQMKIAALGCSAKYDTTGWAPAGENRLVTSGMPVSPTLSGQGIMPYGSTQFGGHNGDPVLYSSYNHDPSVGPANADAKGIGCIPCRFEADETTNPAVMQSLRSTTSAMLTDFSTNTKSSPIFSSIVKLKAPAAAVKTVTFSVRYFGADACSGTNPPPGAYCTSSNVGALSCQAGGVDGGNGNIAAEFSIPVCPGSGFEYDSVSVSWSPLILDVKMSGFKISRDFLNSVEFDMKGNGKPIKVDWPMNTSEVAFLVLPNNAGEVKSIKQLFGDFNAKNGFESLRSLDTNRDGFIDKKDKNFAKLKLWFDRNRNGKVDPGELETLAQNHIEKISLNYLKPSEGGIEGKTLTSVFYNNYYNRFQNVEDVYFHEYNADGARLPSTESMKANVEKPKK